MMKVSVPIFIASYHRPHNQKTVRYLVELGYPSEMIHVFIDSEAEDKADYEEECLGRFHCNLHVFDMEEARRRYDYVHRASVSRRSAGQARNMFMDFARKEGIRVYMVCDDDTECYQLRPFEKYYRMCNLRDIVYTFEGIADMMKRRHIGLFGLPQCGDIYSNEFETTLLRWKVMNTTFVNVDYINRGERGVQDDDTSLFTGVMNAGLFTGSLRYGVVLKQTLSAVSPGGLTDLYHECKLLNKSLVTPIQYPSAIYAEKQVKNGGRLHYRIRYRYLYPCVVKGTGRSNIAWDTYPEDVPFTNEPTRKYTLNR